MAQLVAVRVEFGVRMNVVLTFKFKSDVREVLSILLSIFAPISFFKPVWDVARAM
jgi:hypothetical protein